MNELNPTLIDVQPGLLAQGYFPYALPNIQSLDAEGFFGVMGFGLLVALAVSAYTATERVLRLLNSYSIMGFKAHWALEDVHSGVEADYQALEQAFRVYFNSPNASPASITRRLGVLIVMEAMKGNLRLTGTLLSHLKQLTTQLEPAPVFPKETGTVTQLHYAEALPCPYSWIPALPDDYDTLTQPVHEVSGGNVVGVVAPAKFMPKNGDPQTSDKTAALLLAEILVFGHDA